MQLRPHEIALGIVMGNFDDWEGTIPDPRAAFTIDEAIAFLEDFTGEKFGTDADLWIQWFNECPTDLLNEFYEAYFRLMHSPKGRYFQEMCRVANDRWEKITKRRCPKCQTLCPEFRFNCYACMYKLGRG